MGNATDFTTKLDHEQRMFVFRCHAEGLPYTDIAKEVLERYGVSITPSGIRLTCLSERNQPFIKHFRDIFLAKVKDVPIANKRIRLDDLEKQRLKLVKLLEDNPLKTKNDKMMFLAVCRRLNETVSVARDEMENKPNLVAGVVIGDLNELSDTDLHNRKRELIAKALKSIGGGTARTDESAEGIGDPGEEQSA